MLAGLGVDGRGPDRLLLGMDAAMLADLIYGLLSDMWVRIGMGIIDGYRSVRDFAAEEAEGNTFPHEGFNYLLEFNIKPGGLLHLSCIVGDTF